MPGVLPRFGDLSKMQSDRAEQLVAMRPRLLRRARRYCGTTEAAEDLVQEALLRVWSRLQSEDEIEEIEAYVFTALKNLARRRRPDPLPLDDADIPPEPERVTDRLATKEVLQALERLPAQQAYLLRAYAVEGQSYAEISKMYNLPLGTVMSRVARARARLRTRLDLPRDKPVTRLLHTGS